MDFPSDDKLSSLREWENTRLLCDLDSQGLFARPGEDAPAFATRLMEEGARIRKLRADLEKEGKLEVLVGLGISKGSEIPAPIYEDAAKITRNAYGFEIKWVPGYFPDKGLGLFWGGCSIASSEENPTLFVIRKAFKKKEKFFIYSRTELMAHELCHVARVPMEDSKYEEHFAYAISTSTLRRTTGNCFKSERDAVFFLLPVFALLVIQICRVSWTPAIPSWPFWILAFLVPLLLMLLNLRDRKSYGKARKALSDQGISRPDALLFRCTGREIDEMASLSGDAPRFTEYLKAKQSSDMRWRIMAKRFIEREDELFIPTETDMAIEPISAEEIPGKNNLQGI